MSLLQLIALIYLFGLTGGQLEDSMADPSSLETRDNSTWNVSEYPDPRIVIVGPTGVGKSSLSNALLGCDPISGSCSFPVCGSLNSCTKETTIGTGQWLGDGENFTVVDTPGFGDSDGQDNKLIEEMINVLNDDLGYTNIILLLLDGTMPRFTSGLHNMLRQMSSMFGDAWWNNMVIGVSKWKYSKAAIDERQRPCDYFGQSSEHCKNEEWLMREISAQLQDKFHLDRNFTFAFIHSHSQTVLELTDPVQQEYYQAQAAILWEAATTGDSKFDFKTIDDVLEENELLKKKYTKLNFLFETNIATLYSLVHENQERINRNGEKIVNNEQTITSNEKEMKSSDEKMKENLNNVVDKTVGNERGINSNVEKINAMKVDIKGAVNRINGNEKGIQSNVYNINSNMEKTNGIKGELNKAVNRINGNEKGINSHMYQINTMKGSLKNAVERIDGNEARILSNEKGINSNTVNTNRMKGELKNAFDRIDGNGAKILSNEKAITANGQGIKGNLEKANTMKGDLDEAVNRISGNEKGINSHMYEINTMKGNLKDAVDRIDLNEAKIITNEKAITTNGQGIKGNEKGIKSNMDKMEGELSRAVGRIAVNERKSGELSNTVHNLKLAPIGTIIAWINRPASC